jgi:hypothetical protein
MCGWWAVGLLTPMLGIAQSGLDGVVVDGLGRGIAGALVITSGTGPDRLDTTKADGSFHLKSAGAFLSVAHAAFQPRMLRMVELAASHRVQLAYATEPPLELITCKRLPGNGRGWIGGELRVKPIGSTRGPERTGDVANWFVKGRKSTLRIVDGDAAHAGLPPEEVLRSSARVSLRAWAFHAVLGLEMLGESNDGRRWRWFGSPDGSAIEYLGAAPEDAMKFDRMFGFVCYAAAQLERR